MIRNYLLVAFRNFQRNKIFSFIHVLGLSTGLSASIVIFIITKHEFSFDKIQNDGDRIYRVVMDFSINGTEGHNPAVPAPLPPAISSEVSGIEATIPVMQFQGDATVEVAVSRPGTTNPVVFKKQPEVVFTNDRYFELLPFEWLAGSPKVALKSPFSTVLTKERARQYFPNTPFPDVIGKEIVYDKDLRTFVTGVVNDINDQTDFTAVEFVSYSTIAETSLQQNFMMTVWNDWMAYSKVYVKLKPVNDVSAVEKQLNALLRKYNDQANRDEKNTMAFKLQPLRDIHFNTNYAGFGQRTANKSVLYGLLAIAGFLLLLGCINFINLSTAQATTRAREIGIRKTVGGIRKQLMMQFLIETFCITLVATALSVSLAPLLLQQFSDFVPPGIQFEIWSDIPAIAFLLVLAIAVTFLSGFYPSLILSAMRPILVLRNYSAMGNTTRSAGLRKVLTVGQFVIAQFFVIAAFMVTKQIHYSTSRDLGYRKEAILNFEIPRDTSADHRDILRNEIAGLQGVENVSTGFLPPAMDGGAYANFSFNNGKEIIDVPVQIRWGDQQFISLYNIELTAGRNVQEGKNINEALINESYAKALGFSDASKAIGEHLVKDETSLEIVGIMRDFHESSTHRPIGPLFFRSRVDGRFFHIALSTNNEAGTSWTATIAQMEKAYHRIYPESEFNYSFFDETIAKFYIQEQNTSKLLNWAMALSIFISCLGLLGLVMYTSQTRKKEIGIRKIMGASVSSIVSLLSKEFVGLVLIAFAVTVPLAWWSVNHWLESFAYKTAVSWWIFVASGAVLVIVAMITLSFQTIGTARSNPVESLRSE